MPFDSTDYKPTTSNPTVKTLEAALAFLEEGQHRWCQGALALDKDGAPIRSGIRDLVYSVCSVGAIHKYSQDSLGTIAASEAMLAATGYTIIANFNDAQTTTYEMVLDAFRKAIEIARSAACDVQT